MASKVDGTIVKQLKDKLYECSAAKHVIDWSVIHAAYENEDIVMYDVKDLSARLANLGSDFNKQCYHALENNNEWSQGSIGQKILDLYKKASKVLSLPEWNQYCIECGMEHGNNSLLCCDTCCKGYHESCVKDRNIGKGVLHPLRYLAENKDDCWFCSQGCLREFQSIVQKLKLPASTLAIVNLRKTRHDLRTLSDNNYAYRLVLAANEDTELRPGIVLETSSMNEEHMKALETRARSGAKAGPCKPVVVMQSKAGASAIRNNFQHYVVWFVSTDYCNIDRYSYDDALEKARQRYLSERMNARQEKQFERYFNGAHSLQDFYLERRLGHCPPEVPGDSDPAVSHQTEGNPSNADSRAFSDEELQLPPAKRARGLDSKPLLESQEAEMDPDQHPSFHNQIQEKEPQDVEASIQNEPDDPSQAAGHTAVRPSSQPAPGTPPDPSDGIGRSGPIALYWNRGTDGHVPDPEDHDETPKRTQRILEVLQDKGLSQRCNWFQGRPAREEELLSVHAAEYVQRICSLRHLQPEAIKEVELEIQQEAYLCSGSSEAALLAAGSVVEATLRVLDGTHQAAVCVVRPPGHHAKPACAAGWCLFANVAVAAREALKHAKRVLIVDWDVHHGDGTQEQFLSNDNVLFFSVHRYDGGTFFPGSQDRPVTHGAAKEIGTGRGRHYNINIPWDTRGVSEKNFPGDSEYLDAFETVLLPIARSFKPDIVLVSAGFDAAENDLIGMCKVTPAGYWRLTDRLLTLAGGRLVLALEGGYNIDAMAESLAACVSRLLNDQVMARKPVSRTRAVLKCYKKVIDEVKDLHQHHWGALRARDLFTTLTGCAEQLSSLSPAQAIAGLDEVGRLGQAEGISPLGAKLVASLRDLFAADGGPMP